MISDALKCNTTLTELFLFGEQKQQSYIDNMKIIIIESKNKKIKI